MTRWWFSLIAVSTLSAAPDTYRVNLSTPAWIGTTELKAGSYQIAVDGGKATLKSGGNVVAEVPVKVESGSQKNSSTAISTSTEGSKPVLKEIRVGGTSTRIVFSADGK